MGAPHEATLRARGRRGFTLIEILAVCAIVSVLAALVAAVNTVAVMASNRAKCGNNLRQIGTAVLMYASEHDSALPPTTHSTGDSRIRVNGQWVNTIEYSWIYRVADYLGDVDAVRVCPADDPERQQAILAQNATSYLANDIVFDSEDYGRIDLLPFPARTALAFVSNRPVSRTWDHAHCADWTTWGAINMDIAPDRHRIGERTANRLNGYSNYLFADGHVESIEARALMQMLETNRKIWLPEGR